MGYFNEKAKREIIEYLELTRKPIKVKSGKCRYNFRCQMNAVHEAINNKEKKIAMCIYIHDNYPIIHFINVDKRGKFIDNTLGNWSVKYDYYLIRYIKKKDFYDIDDIFTEYRKEIRTYLSPLTKFFSNVTF